MKFTLHFHFVYLLPYSLKLFLKNIFVVGSLLTGIYRRTGNSTKSEEIVSHFLQDAWATQLPSDTYSGYDVGMALKKFFSILTVPLISTDSQEELHAAFCKLHSSYFCYFCIAPSGVPQGFHLSPFFLNK